METYHQLELNLYPTNIAQLYENTHLHLFAIAQLCNVSQCTVIQYIEDHYTPKQINERNIKAQDFYYQRLQAQHQ